MLNIKNHSQLTDDSVDKFNELGLTGQTKTSIKVFRHFFIASTNTILMERMKTLNKNFKL